LEYYICPPPNAKGPETDAAQHTIELRLSRYVGEGVHEDVDIENHNQRTVRFRLELQVDADFADQAEVKGGRKQHGRLTRRWSSAGARAWELHFNYRAQHRYDHQGNVGVAHLHRGIVLRVEKASSPPRHRGGTIAFTVELRPHEKWHACVIWTPILDDEPLISRYGCYAFFDSDAEWDRKRETYLAECTRFSTPENFTLSGVVSGALEQARRDLDSLRLHDSDEDDRSWTIAAGVPTYLALFGRDTLISSWQSGMLGPEITRGSLRTLVPWQGKEIRAGALHIWSTFDIRSMLAAIP
jgi:glycogen debranching enzyme